VGSAAAPYVVFTAEYLAAPGKLFMQKASIKVLRLVFLDVGLFTFVRLGRGGDEVL